MIVRTYARRSRSLCSRPAVGDEDDDDFMLDPSSSSSLSLSQLQNDQDCFYHSQSQQELIGFPFSSQDSSSSAWSFSLNDDSSPPDPYLPPLPPPSTAAVRKSKKMRLLSDNCKGKENKMVVRTAQAAAVMMTSASTSTLMEAQEFGEMMEHVDEANFALDGLRSGQPLRVQRASLLSLLSICSTSQQRRLLRTQGMAKLIFDAILGLDTTDSPSALAVAALFYALASDGQEEQLLDSPEYVHFLLKLLCPSGVHVEKKSFSGRLAALRKDSGLLIHTSEKVDPTTISIMRKVLELLSSCKDLSMENKSKDILGRPELNSRWVSLLILEKACLSTISLEDTSGAVRQLGGDFKEKLRELGGLDVVFDVAMSCHSVLESLLKESVSSLPDLEAGASMENLAALSKCLKIMENSTFLSRDNQNHLLVMSSKSKQGASSLSFIGLIINVIRVLSGLCLSKDSTSSTKAEASHDCSIETQDQSNFITGVQLKKNGKVKNKCKNKDEACGRCGASDASQNSQGTADSRSQSSGPGSASSVSACNGFRLNSGDAFASSLSNGRTNQAPQLSHVSTRGLLKISVGVVKDRGELGHMKPEPIDGSQDPFAFDEDDLEPSKWEKLVIVKKHSSRKKSSSIANSELSDNHEQQSMTSRSECSVPNSDLTSQKAGTCFSVEEKSTLLEESLVTAVKVLMNLTNDNAVGCQLTGVSGGLDTMASLIIDHFPIFHTSLNASHVNKSGAANGCPNLESKNVRQLRDQELDFLVAILGLLVNLVEKDTANRARLAAAKISLPKSCKSEGSGSSMSIVPLLCSIFLANQGAGEAGAGAAVSNLNDEASILEGQREAEKTIIEAYTALLLAFLSRESDSVRDAIASLLPESSLKVLVPVLERFVAFHLSLNMISPETHAAVSEVIECCRGP